MSWRRLLPALAAGGAAALRVRFSATYRRPLGVYILLTNRCNAACLYCNFRFLAAESVQELPWLSLSRHLRDMRAAGTRRVNLTGGEPLLHSRCRDILALCRELGFYTVLSTNGLAFDSQRDALRLADRVMLSYEGTPAVHDFLRGNGAHARVAAAMRFLQQEQIPFWTTTVLTSRNLHDIDHVLATAAAHGTAANFVLLHFHPDGTPLTHPPAEAAVAGLLPSPEAVRAAFRLLLRRKREGAPVGSSSAYLSLLANWPDYRTLTLPYPRGFRCLAGRLYCHLNYDERLYACGLGPGLQEGISLREHSFPQAFSRLAALPGCAACRTACDVENNLIYNLNPAVISNWFRRF